MNELTRDILIGAFFVVGLMSFIYGEFILSSTFFAVTAIASYIKVNRKPVNTNTIQIWWY